LPPREYPVRPASAGFRRPNFFTQAGTNAPEPSGLPPEYANARVRPLFATTAASASTKAPAGHSTSVHLRGGTTTVTTTTVTTAPGIALTLIENGIVPVGVAPGAEQLELVHGSAAARFAFPVTGGTVSLSPLGGTIDHRGGILFVDDKTGKHVEVSNFVIDLSQGDLTGIVNGNPSARVALFTLSLAHAKLSAGKHCLQATGITVDLTAGAAAALNSAIGTTLFSGGLDLGTAATSVRF
jgi:hypothetical protein